LGFTIPSKRYIPPVYDSGYAFILLFTNKYHHYFKNLLRIFSNHLLQEKTDRLPLGGGWIYTKEYFHIYVFIYLYNCYNFFEYLKFHYLLLVTTNNWFFYKPVIILNFNIKNAITFTYQYTFVLWSYHCIILTHIIRIDITM